ncbi:MAG: hypothetical protein CL663_03370 [Bacteroidetes bacterium]|nr:hypothetical protein [Bacteroidota bacterium]|tara:strand:+ start:198 stop:497 length:300 start_codon:yes stop_codon:yes gene_type:complete
MLEIFSEPFFWIIMGACYTFMFLGASYWAKDLGLKMNVWKWLFTGFWFALLTLTISGGFTLFGENEWRAGYYFLGFLGVIVIILAVVLWRVVKWNPQSK